MKVKIILIISYSINLLFSEISEGIVLLSDYEYDKAVLINIDDEIIHQWDIPGLIKSYLNPDSSLYSFSRVNNEDYFLIQLIDWDGNQLWSYILEIEICRLHHELEILPNGNILCIFCETNLNQKNIFLREV